MTWTPAEDLVAITNAPTLSAALTAVGLGGNELRTFQDWYRAGSESYLFVAEVLANGSPVGRVVFKALTPAPGTMSVQEAIDSQLERHHLLDALGVPVVKIYGAHNGNLVEE